MTLCYRCKERPVPPCYLKHQHYRCYRCHTEQYRELRRKADRRRAALPHIKAANARRQREYRKRRVRIGTREFTFPTVAAKQQASELIARRRDEFKQRQQGRA